MKEELLVNSDFRDFLEIINKYNVDYCIVGAFAVGFYAEPRYTQDIDIYVSNKPENAIRIADAVKEFTGEKDAIENDFFTKDKVILRMGIKPNQIELTNHLHGLTDDEILQDRVKSKYGEITTYYIGLDDFIKNKKVIKDLPHRNVKQKQDARDYYILEKLRHKKVQSNAKG
jgi:hypothetical protein